MKDLRINIKLKNNVLYTLRTRAGLNFAQLSEVCGAPASTICYLENLKISPLTLRGDRFIKPVIQLANYFKVTPDYLFPEALDQVKNTEKSIEVNIQEFIEIAATDSPLKYLENKEVQDKVTKALEELPERDRYIVESLYGFEGQEKSISEVAKDLKVCQSRVGQLHYNALRNLKKRLK